MKIFVAEHFGSFPGQTRVMGYFLSLDGAKARVQEGYRGKREFVYEQAPNGTHVVASPGGWRGYGISEVEVLP